MPVFKEIPESTTGHVPIKIWTDTIEQAIKQHLFTWDRWRPALSRFKLD